MSAIHTAIWKNLLHLSSLLQENGLVVEFNGVFRSIGKDEYEITSNKDSHPVYSETSNRYYLDEEEKGFYRRSEYAGMERTRDYSLKFLDGGLLQYFCLFEGADIVRQRLCFYQSPVVRNYDSDHKDYNDWVASATDADEESKILFGYPDFEYRDVGSFRMEYAPDQYQSIVHPRTHMHLNSIEGCRIPVEAPLGVAVFLKFIIKNFYSESWVRISPLLVDSFNTSFKSTIDDAERAHLHLSFPTQ